MPSDIVITKGEFSYGELAPPTAEAARADAEWIRDRWRRLQGEAVEGMIAIGLRLIEARERVGHGNFLPWIAAEFDFNRQTAQNMICAAAQFGANVQRVGHLPQRTLYLLAAPSTPEAIRNEVLSLPREATPSFPELKEMIRTAKAVAVSLEPSFPKTASEKNEERRLQRLAKEEAEHKARRAIERKAAADFVCFLQEALGEQFDHAIRRLEMLNMPDIREALACYYRQTDAGSS